MYNDITNRLSKWASGKKEAPQRVLLYPTNSCNLNCVFCYQTLKPYDYSLKLPKEKWLNITKELCKMGVKTLQISGGGEPLLEADIVLSMMKIIKKHNVEGRLVTNGTIFNNELIEDIVKIQWDHIIFSVDSAKAATHDFLRGKKGSFRKTVHAIRMFKRIKEIKATEKPLMEFSSVLTKMNFKQINGIIKLAYELGVKVITFEPVFVSNPYVHKIKMNSFHRKRFVKKIIPSALDLSRKYGIITNLAALREIKEIEKTGDLKEKIVHNKNIKNTNSFLDIPCYDPWLWPKIEADGRIGPCSSILFEKENIRNKTFREIWYGKQFQEFRSRIKNRDLPDSCANCVSTHLPLNNSIREKLREVYN